MSLSTRLGLLSLAAAATLAMSGCVGHITPTTPHHDADQASASDPGPGSASADAKPAFGIPKSCDAIKFSSIVHKLIPDNADPHYGSDNDNGSTGDELDCSVVAEAASPGYTVWVSIMKSDCLNPTEAVKNDGSDPSCMDVKSDECKSTDGSAKYNGLACADPDGTVLKYQLPSVTVVINMGEAKDPDYFEKWASAVADAAKKAGS